MKISYKGWGAPSTEGLVERYGGNAQFAQLII